MAVFTAIGAVVGGLAGAAVAGTAVAGAIGVSISPELFEAIASTAVAVIGLIQIIKKEKASDSAEEGN